MFVETKLTRLVVETRFTKLGVDINPLTVEMYPRVPRPVVVDTSCLSKKLVLTRPIRLFVETKLTRLGVETRFNKLGVEIKG